MKDDVELVARTKSFALRVVRLFGYLPKTTEAHVLGKQVLRSGTSVGANYREAQRARSKAEHRSHGMALGSLQFLQPSGERSGKRPRQFISKIGDYLKELDEPSGARQTMRQHCPKGERGSAHQTSYWLELLAESGITDSARLAPLQDECNQLLAIFTTISKKAKSNPS